MPFKSKAEIRKWGELVKQGKISQAKFDEALSATKDAHKLPERVGTGKPNSVADLKNLGRRFGVKK